MKKFLLFAAAVLMITSANAQHKAPVVQNRKTLAKEKLSQLPPMQKLDFNQYSSIREMTIADPR